MAIDKDQQEGGLVQWDEEYFEAYNGVGILKLLKEVERTVKEPP
jgi:hypothetical protein